MYQEEDKVFEEYKITFQCLVFQGLHQIEARVHLKFWKESFFHNH